MTIEYKNNTTQKYHSSKLFLQLNLDVVNINKHGSALGVIPLVIKMRSMTKFSTIYINIYCKS
jgi:hypothetical protein